MKKKKNKQKETPEIPLLHCHIKRVQHHLTIDCPSDEVAIELIEQRQRIQSMLSLFPQIEKFRFLVNGENFSGIYSPKRSSEC